MTLLVWGGVWISGFLGSPDHFSIQPGLKRLVQDWVCSTSWSWAWVSLCVSNSIYLGQWFFTLTSHWNHLRMFKNHGCLGESPEVLVSLVRVWHWIALIYWIVWMPRTILMRSQDWEPLPWCSAQGSVYATVSHLTFLCSSLLMFLTLADSPYDCY